jgi:hypothetical protein
VRYICLRIDEKTNVHGSSRQFNRLTLRLAGSLPRSHEVEE